MSPSFLSRIRYKRERVGIVEKEGKTYVKYIKARRFRVNRTVKHAVLGGFIFLVLALGIKLLISEFASRQPPEETVEGGAG